MFKPEVNSAVKFACEEYSLVIEEAKPILTEHWEELSFYPDIPLDPEYALYEALEKSDSLAIATVRVHNELVGYAVNFVRRHLHYRNHVWAINDIILIRKPYRRFGIGNQFFAFIESDLKAREVDVFHINAKVLHPELLFLLRSRGYKEVEIGLSLRL